MLALQDYSAQKTPVTLTYNPPNTKYVMGQARGVKISPDTSNLQILTPFLDYLSYRKTIGYNIDQRFSNDIIVIKPFLLAVLVVELFFFAILGWGVRITFNSASQARQVHGSWNIPLVRLFCRGLSGTGGHSQGPFNSKTR